MTKALALLSATALLALSACGGSNDGESADDFASRIGSAPKSEAPKPQGTVAPKVQEIKPGAAPGPFTAGTQTDPDAACQASKVGEFIGKEADAPTRVAIQKAAVGASEVRFIGHENTTFINPDPTSPRLNLMLDKTNIIRDARCG